MRKTGPVFLALMCVLAAGGAPVEYVRESPRNLPVVFDGDVVVAGGTTGAVAAAVSAARAGGRVFLAAPRPCLGEDMCRTRRLWLEPDEKPRSQLERDLFEESAERRALRFTYQADQPSTKPHLDTDPPRLLNDGRWSNAYSESVQYNGDVHVLIDLGGPREVEEVRLCFFQGNRDYEVASMTVEAAAEDGTWTPLGSVKNAHLRKGNWVESPLEMKVRTAARARRLRVTVAKTPEARRMLLGEILVLPRRDASREGGVALTPPIHVKRTLERALVEAGVTFVYSSPAVEILTDASGAPAGVVLANRAGRQAVRAPVIIDASMDACLARAAGAVFRPVRPGTVTFRRIVAGGSPHRGPGLRHRWITLRSPLGDREPVSYGSGGFRNRVRERNSAMKFAFDRLIEYSVDIPLQSGTFAEFAEAEQKARDLTFDPLGLETSDRLFFVPPDSIVGTVHADVERAVGGNTPLDAFRPRGIPRLYILNGYADVSRQAAERLLRPLELMRAGVRIGTAAAAEAARVRPSGEVRLVLTGNARGPTVPGADTRELRHGLRPAHPVSAWVRAEARNLPVLGRYDVVIVGGGTSGAPAAVAAARSGVKTLVIEFLDKLGGVGTTGLIGIYCAGYRHGFTAEVDRGVAAVGSPSTIHAKQEWWRREIRKAGGEVWFGVLACGAVVEGNRVCGVVVATPQGRGAVLARCVVDATGNADVAVAAGGKPMYIGSETVAMQGTGLPNREIGADYINTDWTFVDETDLVDVTTAYAAALRRYAGAWDLAELIDTRERRRIRGDVILTPLDIITHRVFPDAVAVCQGGRLDKHGFTVHPYYYIRNYYGGIATIPYRCLLPRGLDGILVIGLGISAHVDAIPSVRMQPDMQNLGYAAGLAAAEAAKMGGSTRSIDVRVLQKRLLAKGCLTPEAASGRDSWPIPDNRVHAAVRRLIEKDYEGLAEIMAAWDRARALLERAVRSETSPEARLRCAHVLGIMGAPAGADVLLEKVRSITRLDTESIDRYFPCVTWLDSYIIALGRTRDSRAVPVLLEKLPLLNEENGGRLSHYRAFCEAFEYLGAREAARPLAELLKLCGLDAPVVTPEQVLRGQRVRGKGGLRNLILARVCYRCGDWQGIARRVLEAYTRDVRGVYARHARAVLSRQPGAPTRPDGWLGL